jgi:hypothetical protein
MLREESETQDASAKTAPQQDTILRYLLGKRKGEQLLSLCFVRG